MHGVYKQQSTQCYIFMNGSIIMLGIKNQTQAFNVFAREYFWKVQKPPR